MSGDEQLISRWRLMDFDVGAGEPAGAFDAPMDATGWIDIPAPGDTYLALHAAGRLPDPFGDRAEEQSFSVVRFPMS